MIGLNRINKPNHALDPTQTDRRPFHCACSGALNSTVEKMETLYNEISWRFPEVRSAAFDDNADDPYALMTMLADWLRDASAQAMTPELIERVQAFARWCENQPRGETAADDILTILVVGFYERLFATEHTRRILTKLISKQTFEANHEYLETWIGEKNYQKARSVFSEEPPAKNRL